MVVYGNILSRRDTADHLNADHFLRRTYVHADSLHARDWIVIPQGKYGHEYLHRVQRIENHGVGKVVYSNLYQLFRPPDQFPMLVPDEPGFVDMSSGKPTVNPIAVIHISDHTVPAQTDPDSLMEWGPSTKVHRLVIGKLSELDTQTVRTGMVHCGICGEDVPASAFEEHGQNLHRS